MAGHYPEVYIGFGQSEGTFTTPPIEVSGATTVVTPVSFMGTVAAFASASALPTDAPLFTRQWNGVGTATARFEIIPAQGGMSPVYSPIHPAGADDHLRYEFAPVPEPATLLLVGAGLPAGVARRRWR